MSIPSWNLQHFAIGEINKKLDDLYRMNYIAQLRLLHANCDWIIDADLRDDYNDEYEYWGDFIFRGSQGQIEDHHRMCQNVHDDEFPSHETYLQEFLDAGNTLEKVNMPDWDGHYLVNRIDMTKEDVQRWVEDLLTNFEQCPKCGAFRSVRTKACASCVRQGLVQVA